MIRISPLLLLILLSFTDHVGSVVLTSVPLTAIDEELFTMICSSNTSRESMREWYRSGSSIPAVSNPNVFNKYLSGRINVSCDVHQHNVTLRINSTIDNQSWWTCFDNTNSQRSNTMTINVVNLTTMPSTTATAATIFTAANLATTTTTEITANVDISSSTSLQERVSPADHGANEKPTSGDDAPNVVYIAVGAAVGGVVVGCVITIIVVIIWMRRRNTSTEDDASAPNIYTSPSHYEDMGHQYGKVERQYVNTGEGIGRGSPDSVNTEDQAGNAAYYNTAGQHQHRDEHANTGNTTYYNDSR